MDTFNYKSPKRGRPKIHPPKSQSPHEPLLQELLEQWMIPPANNPNFSEIEKSFWLQMYVKLQNQRIKQGGVPAAKHAEYMSTRYGRTYTPKNPDKKYYTYKPYLKPFTFEWDLQALGPYFDSDGNGIWGKIRIYKGDSSQQPEYLPKVALHDFTSSELTQELLHTSFSATMDWLLDSLQFYPFPYHQYPIWPCIFYDSFKPDRHCYPGCRKYNKCQWRNPACQKNTPPAEP